MRKLSQIMLFIFLFCFGLIISWVVSEKDIAPSGELTVLYENNMKPCMNYWTTDPSYTDTVSMHMQAMRLYDKGEYRLALEALQRFEPNEKDYGIHSLYTGICLLKSDFDNLAISKFQDAVAESKKFEMIQMSKWYLAMAYLKAGRQKEATQTLKKIIEVNAPQRYQAQLIVEEIDKASHPLKSFVAIITP